MENDGEMDAMRDEVMRPTGNVHYRKEIMRRLYCGGWFQLQKQKMERLLCLVVPSYSSLPARQEVEYLAGPQRTFL